MYRNIRLSDLPHLVFLSSRFVDTFRAIMSKSFMMLDNDGIKGCILLKKKKMDLHVCNNNDEALQFLRIYAKTEFDTYEIVSLYQKDDDEVIYNIFDMVLNKLNNGDFLWGKVNKNSDHYVYRKLGFIALNDKIYAYQHTL